MSRNSTLILIGVLTVLIPFSGLPIAIRTLLTVISGACVFGIGLALRTAEAHKVQQSAGGGRPHVATLDPETPATPVETTANPHEMSSM